MVKIVIVVYRPKPGRDAELEALVRRHYDILVDEKLVSDRRPMIMRARTGEVIEIFEWRSADAIKQAHSNTNILKLWDLFNQVCTYEPPVNVAEFSNLFSEFESID